MVQIHLVRHGQASFHAADYDQLSELGLEQSPLLGDWFGLCGWPIHHVVAGSMKRHLQTAEAFFSAYSGKLDWRDRLERTDDFNECDHRDIFARWVASEDPLGSGAGFKFSEMTSAEFAIRMPRALSRWTSGHHDSEYREPWPLFTRRCLAALDQARAMAGADENVLVFTSSVTISAICQSILGAPAEQIARLVLDLANGSLTSIRGREDGSYSVSCFNAKGHLDRMARPELVTIK